MLVIIQFIFIVILLAVLTMLLRHERALGIQNAPKAQIEKYWNGLERRRYVRFNADLTVNYNIKEKDQAKQWGHTVDVSDKGMRLLVDKKISSGTIIGIEIFAPHSTRSIELESQVVWCNEAKDREVPSDKRLFHIGIKILAIKQGSSAAFFEFIKSLEEDVTKQSA